jgi:hypothetical protein
MFRFFLAPIFLICISAGAHEVCSDLSTSKDCAELGCYWSDQTQTCLDEAMDAAKAGTACENIKSIELCESRSECTWNWTRCELRD